MWRYTVAVSQRGQELIEFRRIMGPLLVVTVLAARETFAQLGTMGRLPQAGGEIERYLRALSLVGIVEAPQWTIRPFGPREPRFPVATQRHPWESVASSRPGLGTWILPATVRSTYNSTAPFGFNDGPVWAGRGITASASAGLALEWKSVSAIVNPVAFWTANAAFTMAPNGRPGARAFGDWLLPDVIDLPQRFGDNAYRRIEPGETTVRFAPSWLDIGGSTASEVWGPAVEHPIILGTNAGGIPRIFIGSPRPAEFLGLRMHGRVFWGVVHHSAYALTTEKLEKHHPVTGIVAMMSAKAVPGLELGGSRFFHIIPGASPRLNVFSGILKSSLAQGGIGYEGADNQLASVFFRWAPPAAGFEFYGEFGREDHNGVFRDFLKEPDHDAAYLIGFQRAWRREGDSTGITVARGEILNARISHLTQASRQAQWYIHGSIPQGHTMGGQVLGSAAAYGGGGASFGVDRYSPAGRTTLRFDRLMAAERLNEFQMPLGRLANVVYAAGIERTRFGSFGETGWSVTMIHEFNRHFRSDATGVSLSGWVRLKP